MTPSQRCFLMRTRSSTVTLFFSPPLNPYCSSCDPVTEKDGYEHDDHLWRRKRISSVHQGQFREELILDSTSLFIVFLISTSFCNELWSWIPPLSTTCSVILKFWVLNLVCRYTSAYDARVLPSRLSSDFYELIKPFYLSSPTMMNKQVQWTIDTTYIVRHLSPQKTSTTNDCHNLHCSPVCNTIITKISAIYIDAFRNRHGVNVPRHST